MKPFSIVTILIFCMLIVSCNKKPTQTESTKSDLIEFTKAQFQSEKAELGEPKRVPFSETVRFTGTVIPSANAKAQISLPVAGVINKIYCNPGQLVNKGQVLFDVSGNEFIDMQKDFAESSALIKRLKSDYERAAELYGENIGSQKDFILAESSYKVENARYNALKLKLERTGLDVSKIEDGTFYHSFSIKAVIKGYITRIQASIGQYAEQQFNLAELVDVERLQLKVSVFEKDIQKIKIGQNVEFYLAGDQTVVYNARINSVGKIINSETKAIDCYADILDFKSLNPVGNLYAEGRIIFDTDSVYSLPETAFLKSENESYILKLEKETDESYYFSKLRVKTGRHNENSVELTEKPEVEKVLINGGYNIQIE